MNSQMSEDFQEFHNHVFGDSQYFYYNGLADELCTNLKGAERNIAEEMVLRALPNSTKDERPIRAAGHFKLQSAIPVLEKLLSEHKDERFKNVKAAIIWAKLKIQHDKTQLKLLIEYVVNQTETISDLRRDDATDLLSEFSEDPKALETLFRAFTDEDFHIRSSAGYALHKLFKHNLVVSELLRSSFAGSQYECEKIVEKIKALLYK